MYALISSVLDGYGLREGLKRKAAVDPEYDAPVLRICDMLSSVTATIVSTHGEIGGIVLQDIVGEVGWFGLWEKPTKLPKWTELKSFSEMIGIAVSKLERGTALAMNCRRNLIVSLPRLERELGCLVEIQNVVNLSNMPRRSRTSYETQMKSN